VDVGVAIAGDGGALSLLPSYASSSDGDGRNRSTSAAPPPTPAPLAMLRAGTMKLRFGCIEGGSFATSGGLVEARAVESTGWARARVLVLGGITGLSTCHMTCAIPMIVNHVPHAYMCHTNDLEPRAIRAFATSRLVEENPQPNSPHEIVPRLNMSFCGQA
jgi:hypothetical protein